MSKPHAVYCRLYAPYFLMQAYAKTSIVLTASDMRFFIAIYHIDTFIMLMIIIEVYFAALMHSFP